MMVQSKNIGEAAIGLVVVLEAYSEPCKIYKMDRFGRQLTTFNPGLFSPS